jgi:hypothetical protein
MITYLKLMQRARELGARSIKTCHIAHVKAHHGLTTRQAANRIDAAIRKYRCPPYNWQPIEQAMRECGVLT